MPLFVIFIFGAVVIGAGAMLAPAWPTVQPRVGLAAALALGLVMGGAIFWAMLFGWNTLVIDYLLFALVTTIFLGGTLSYGQRRAEKRGETLEDADQGWPGPRDLLFFVFVALVFAVPALVLPVPLGTDAQGFGYLGLMTRLGGGFQTLAPWHPEITYLYAPGFPLLIAYLSQQLGVGLHVVQFGVAAVLAVLLVWLAYDFGAELRDKRLGRAMAVTMLAGVGLFTAYMDSHFTTLLGLVFGLAFLTYALRYLRHRAWPDAVAAGLMLGALVLSHPDTTIIIGLGYVPWLLTMWWGRPRPTLRVWLVLALGVPLVALLAVSPWLLNVRDLLGSDIVSPFSRNPDYWRMMLFYHGVWVVPVAVVGAVVGLRCRDQGAILAVGWLVLVLEFASLGLLERLVPGLIAPVLRYDYPFSIAWHGPIIPYSILGGIGLLWLWNRWLEARAGRLLHRAAYGLIGVLVAAALGVLVFNRQLLDLSKGRVGFYGAFASEADVRAMDWLRENTPPDARVLNFPGTLKDNSHESDWVPVIAERDSVYYRWQPFFRGNEASLAEQERLRAFWHDPADPANAALLRDAGIDYVIVPQLVTDPASIQTMFRWGEPFTDDVEMRSRVADAPYLQRVFADAGAEVYAVVE
ncbi:MAG: hypothetical protein HZC41_02295 [Chloroflexi bacterium]|nr:hypothetical protein [Chloroflexota bacterium]